MGYMWNLRGRKSLSVLTSYLEPNNKVLWLYTNELRKKFSFEKAHNNWENIVKHMKRLIYRNYKESDESSTETI